MTDWGPGGVDDLRPAREALAAIGQRAEIARRLELGGTEAVLRSIVEAAVLLFEAEAASMALFDAARNVLVFRVAAGAQGQGVVGLEIPPDRGLVGYVFSTGQALAISDVARDPRFGRSFAEQTQYVPRSIVAVPLVDERGTIGVLEVLDKRTEATFSIRDVELAGVFARQASVAIRSSRVERDVAALLGVVLGALAADGVQSAGVPSAGVPSAGVPSAGVPSAGVPSAGVQQLVEAAVADVGGPDDPLWPLVEQIAALRRASPEQLELVTGLLAVLVRQAERAAGGGRGPRRRPPGR